MLPETKRCGKLTMQRTIGPGRERKKRHSWHTIGGPRIVQAEGAKNRAILPWRVTQTRLQHSGDYTRNLLRETVPSAPCSGRILPLPFILCMAHASNQAAQTQ